MFVNGIAAYINQMPGFNVVATAANGSELIARLNDTPCDLVITDYSMPAASASPIGDGLQLLSYLQRHYPDKKLIVLTMNSIPAVLHQIIESGINGVMHKSDELDEIGQGINHVARNVPYIGSSIRALLKLKTPAIDELTQLSARETEVLRLFAENYSLQKIATHLNKSIKTISLQKISAMKKLGLESDVQLGAYFSNHRLVVNKPNRKR